MAFGIKNSIFGKKTEITKSISSNCRITIEDLRNLAKLKGTDDLALIEKEYFQELILYLLSDTPGIIFKGGTTLRKFWNSPRFSADLDFVGDVIPSNVLDELLVKLKQWGYNTRIGDVREYGDGNITVKLTIRGIVYLYHHIIIDLFPTSPITISPSVKKVKSIFPGIPPFSITVFSLTEALAEKVRTLFSRKRSQDLYDINFLLKLTPVDWKLLYEKFDYDGLTFSYDELKKRINDYRPVWEKELSALFSEVPNFHKTGKKVLEGLQETIIHSEIGTSYSSINSLSGVE
ncbi:MAG: nucleotidyl transferase AbiEii/AbiGii toxin family protein [Candidatus Hodarchaeales archaeon]